MAKVLVSLDDRLLQRIDRAAAARGMSRSAYLAHLAELGLGDGVGSGRSAPAQRALGALDDLFARRPMPEDPTAAIRAERDAR